MRELDSAKQDEQVGPGEALHRLVAEEPGAVNPAMSLLLLERPGLLRDLSPGQRLALLLHPDVPISFLVRLATHPVHDISYPARLQLALATLEGSVQPAFLSRGDPVGGSWRPSERQAQMGHSLWKSYLWPGHVVEGLLVELLALGPLPPWYVPVLMVHGGERMRKPLLQLGRVPPALRQQFCLAGVTWNLSGITTRGLLDTPQPTKWTELRWKHRVDNGGIGESDPGFLSSLADGDEWAQVLAARHPQTPAAALITMATSNPRRPTSVRLTLAQRAALPEAAARRLACDFEFSVQLALACNLSAETIEAYSRDDWWQVRRFVARHRVPSPEMLASLICDPSGEVRIGLASNPELPPDALDTLAQDKSPSVRYAVAQHGRASPELLQRLLRDRTEGVRRAAVRNPGLPAEVMAALRAAGDPVLALLEDQDDDEPAY